MKNYVLTCLGMILSAGMILADDESDARARAALAIASANVSQRTRPTDGAQPSYRWTTETPGQLTLWRGDVQVGGWRKADGAYLSCESGVWTETECPTALPKDAVSAKAAKLAAWNSHPLNLGSCPCSKIGGCRCDPHSDCAAGKCAQHNPNLQTVPAVTVRQPFQR
jgi:hypothetical protein